MLQNRALRMHRTSNMAVVRGDFASIVRIRTPDGRTPIDEKMDCCWRWEVLPPTRLNCGGASSDRRPMYSCFRCVSQL